MHAYIHTGVGGEERGLNLKTSQQVQQISRGGSEVEREKNEGKKRESRDEMRSREINLDIKNNSWGGS